ncbi:hypothetical protein SKAU_G00141280 [Synaphobranchus kaupii]|uniref:Uncharacterized protein n=1 Tax=Synaphobranchus kaupii TaxID=118154 RepID=A0A9Q1J264_SYNKA|nr:hypothetical protein SKAU_G00141280 [Synaphobranchus kaupii]
MATVRALAMGLMVYYTGNVIYLLNVPISLLSDLGGNEAAKEGGTRPRTLRSFAVRGRWFSTTWRQVCECQLAWPGMSQSAVSRGEGSVIMWQSNQHWREGLLQIRIGH